jgi:uncharacterized protein
MGVKYILFGLALWVIYRILRYFLSKRSHQQTASSEVKSVDSVKCAYCGLHIPKTEALKRGSDYYCCKAHLKAADEEIES